MRWTCAPACVSLILWLTASASTIVCIVFPFSRETRLKYYQSKPVRKRVEVEERKWYEIRNAKMKIWSKSEMLSHLGRDRRSHELHVTTASRKRLCFEEIRTKYSTKSENVLMEERLDKDEKVGYETCVIIAWASSTIASKADAAMTMRMSTRDYMFRL